MNKVVLKFTELSTGKTIEFPLISKYSIITGLSESGKIQFYKNVNVMIEYCKKTYADNMIINYIINICLFKIAWFIYLIVQQYQKN